MRNLYEVRSTVDRLVQEAQRCGRPVEISDADITLSTTGHVLFVRVLLSDDTFIDVTVDLQEPIDPHDRGVFEFYRDEMESAFLKSRMLH